MIRTKLGRSDKFFIGCVFLGALCPAGFGQVSSTGSSNPTAGMSASNDSTPQINGSVPQGTATATPIALSLSEAVNRGLKANLGVLTSEQSSNEVRAQRLRSLSVLLPTVTGEIAQHVDQVDLQTFGISFKSPLFSIPTIVGPFGFQSALANASVPIFNYSSISNLRASRESGKAAVLSVKNARDLVVQAVADGYLQIIADAARVVATRAEIEADSAIFNNATARHDAGTAIAIDVLRSQVELKQRQQTLVAESNQFEIDKLSLGRLIGLPPGQEFVVSDPSPTVPVTALTLPDALAKAYANRPDFQAAKARVGAARFSLSSAHAERYPTLQANGNYGDEGLHWFTNSHGVFSFTGSLQFNIFDGGRIKADIQEDDAELKNRENELENLRGQIDFDVRSALLNMKSAADQVEVAQANIELAGSTLKQSRDRFTAGVSNTVEVVQAQQTVADADQALIAAQFQLNTARVSLARALGAAEDGLKTYFNNTHQ